MDCKQYSVDDWQKEARRRFGNNVNDWRFTCPSCGHVQTRDDFLAMGLPERQVDFYLAYTCIGHFRQTDSAATIVEVFDLDVGWGCKYQGGLEPNVSPVLLATSPEEWRPTFGFTPRCDACWDDRVVCTRCEQRPVDCNCGRWIPTFQQELKDCDDCRRRST